MHITRRDLLTGLGGLAASAALSPALGQRTLDRKRPRVRYKLKRPFLERAISPSPQGLLISMAPTRIHFPLPLRTRSAAMPRRGATGRNHGARRRRLGQ